MFTKLAMRNVKRQLGNYLIYFMTVSLTVSFIFAINNVIYSPQLLQWVEEASSMKIALIGLTIFISLIVAFVLGYATAFMLKLRKREFGTYLTLGMTRKNILSIFVSETMIMCFTALGLGILLGLFIYQGLIMIMSNLMEMEFTFADYSAKGLLLTVVLVAAMFAISSMASARYLKKVSIYELIHGDQMVEKRVKHPTLWLLLTLISLSVVIGSCVMFCKQVDILLLKDASSLDSVFISLFVLAGGLIVFHTAVSRSIVNLLLKRKHFCSSGSHTFVLRQLSASLRANSIMIGMIAFLMAFAVIGANASFALRANTRAVLDRDIPFDALYIEEQSDTDNQYSPISVDEGEKMIEKYAKIVERLPFAFYTTGRDDLHNCTEWSGEDDLFITESDFNKICQSLGFDPVQLNQEYLVIANDAYTLQFDFSQTEIGAGGRTYRYGGISQDYPHFAYVYFYVVIPDEAVKNMETATRCAAYDLADGKYDGNRLKEELSYTVPGDDENDGPYEMCNYVLKEYNRIRSNSILAVFVVGALYIAAIFLFMAMAILALKILSTLAEDKKRYRVLYRLGADEQEQSKALFQQTFSFFFLPFAIPILLSIPTGWICGRIMKLTGFAAQQTEVYLIAAVIALVMILIYVLYFTATYQIAKRTVIVNNQSGR